jgi:hypothetical protein
MIENNPCGIINQKAETSVHYVTPTPDERYLELLGRAAYTWAYTEWTILYIIRWATGDDLSVHVGGTGGRIVGTFRDLVHEGLSIDGLFGVLGG